MSVTQTLTLTEVSTDNENNTSQVRILWKSTQSGDSHNDYSRTAKYYVSVNGGAETVYTKTYTLPQNSTVAIVDTTISVKHKDDGKGSISVRTWMDTEISAGVVQKTQSLTLTTIPRASTLNGVSSLTRNLGVKCVMAWTPHSASFRYKVKYSIGSYSFTSRIIHPNKTTSFTWSEDTLSYEMAKQFPNSDSGTVTVTLYTYSDSNATVQVGSPSSTSFTAYLRPGEALPNVTMLLSPVSAYEGFTSVYIQGKSKVQASFSGSGQYGASIVSYSLKVGTKTYSAPYLSDIIGEPNNVVVEGTATDSRGRTKTVKQTITVLPYSKPSIIPYTGQNQLICKRCLSDGTPDNGGSYLLIQIGRKYNKLTSGGKQMNFCSLKYSYKTDAQGIASYSDPKTILDRTASTDFVSVILPNIVASNTTAYNIQLIAEDDLGENDIVTITVGTMFVTVHFPEGGHGVTFGGYHDPSKYDVFDCRFNAEFNGTVSGSVYGLLGSSGEIPANGNLNDYRTPGIYAIPSSTRAETLTNMPYVYNPADGKTYRLSGLLRVYATIGQDYVSNGAMKYVTQEFRPLAPQIADYRRLLQSNEDGEWSYGEWMSTRGN
jgi:hypothetical protein